MGRGSSSNVNVKGHVATSIKIGSITFSVLFFFIQSGGLLPVKPVHLGGRAVKYHILPRFMLCLPLFEANRLSCAIHILSDLVALYLNTSCVI